MRPPASAITGNLVWSRTGRTWAVWRVRETPYLWLDDRRKHAEHSRTRAALAALPAESMILSVAARVDPGEVIDAMTDGVDLDAHPGWVEAVEATLDRVESADIYRRRHYLCVQLPDDSHRGPLGDLLRAATGPVIRSFGLAALPIPVRHIEVANRRAEELASQLRTLQLEPVTAGELRWLYARAPRRGLLGELPLAGWPEPALRLVPHDGASAVASPSLAPLLDGRFVEGGNDDDQDRPRHRRYLRVDTDAGSSYQTFAVVADTPEQFAFPGGLSAWLSVADQLDFPVDWACRIRAVPNYTAARAATRQQRQLAGQVHEYDAEPAGPPPSLASAMEAIDDERAQLAANPSEPELQISMVYALASDNLADLEQQAGELQSIYRSAEFHLPRPTGGQRELFEALLPGSSTPRVCHDYRQYMLPGAVAASMPFAGVGLGDRAGMLLGASRDAGCARPVLIDPSAGPRNDRDGSIAAFGTLGSGKSYLAKRLAATVLLRGGKIIAVDRTQAGEYVRFADAMAATGVATQVLTLDDPAGLLLDPLRVFAGDTARQTAVGYLSMVCRADPTGLDGATLSKAVDNVAERGGTLADVLAELRDLADSGPEYRHGSELAVRLAALANNRFGAPAWGDGASIDTTVDCTVIHLPHLAVPGREVLLSEHLARSLQPEQICSLGLLYLVTALARHIAYADADRFAALALDEAWALTYTLPGQQLLYDTIRDGRKHNAAAWVFSQNPDDLPPELRDMVSVRFLFGLTGKAAVTGLEWMHVDASQENVALVEEWAARRDPEAGAGDTAPICLLRDGAGRVGSVQITEAETARLRAGFESNPTRLTAASSIELDRPVRAQLDAAGSGEQTELTAVEVL